MDNDGETATTLTGTDTGSVLSEGSLVRGRAGSVTSAGTRDDDAGSVVSLGSLKDGALLRGGGNNTAGAGVLQGGRSLLPGGGKQ